MVLESPDFHHFTATHMPGCVFRDPSLFGYGEPFKGSSTKFPINRTNCFTLSFRLPCPVSHYFFFVNRLVQALFVKLDYFPSINVERPCLVSKLVSRWFRVSSSNMIENEFL
jgi:hypothetical protein